MTFFRKKSIGICLGAFALALSVAGCGAGSASYKDGVYTGQSAVFENDDGTDDGNGYGVATITIEGGEITACEFETYEPDGKRKDEDYGKVDGAIANQDFYNKAQKAIGACPRYAAALVEAGSLKEVDAISGATINYNAFLDAVENALQQAKE